MNDKIRELTQDEMVKFGVVIDKSDAEKRIKINDRNWDEIMRINQDDFIPGRPVIDFDIINATDTGTNVKMFVFYTHQDHYNYPNIKLGKFNNVTQSWNVFKDGNDTPIRPQEIENPFWRGFFYVEFNTIDPPIAVGR